MGDPYCLGFAGLVINPLRLVKRFRHSEQSSCRLRSSKHSWTERLAQRSQYMITADC